MRSRSLVIPTSWQTDLLERLQSTGLHERVKELFGSLPSSAIGSGRAESMLPAVNRRHIERHIELVHSIGLEFNYCVNAPCLGNQEYHKGGHAEIVELLAWIHDSGADAVTVSSPYLAELIRARFPRLKICVSVIAQVDSVPKAKMWESLGVDRITLDSMANRDFELIQNIRRAIGRDLAVLTNDSCLYACPFRIYHYNVLGHDSQSCQLDELESSYARYPMVKCILVRLSDPAEIIKSRWIRPEDLDAYEGLGIDYFKIAGRSRPTEWIVRCLKAYTEAKYEGNLLDIVPLPADREAMVFLSASGLREIDSEFPFYVDNQQLDGVIRRMAGMKCSVRCGSCDFCSKVARRAVKIVSRKGLGMCKKALESALDSLRTGEFLQREGSWHRTSIHSR